MSLGIIDGMSLGIAEGGVLGNVEGTSLGIIDGMPLIEALSPGVMLRALSTRVEFGS